MRIRVENICNAGMWSFEIEGWFGQDVNGDTYIRKGGDVPEAAIRTGQQCSFRVDDLKACITFRIKNRYAFVNDSWVFERGCNNLREFVGYDW